VGPWFLLPLFPFFFPSRPSTRAFREASVDPFPSEPARVATHVSLCFFPPFFSLTHCSILPSWCRNITTPCAKTLTPSFFFLQSKKSRKKDLSCILCAMRFPASVGKATVPFPPPFFPPRIVDIDKAVLFSPPPR